MLHFSILLKFPLINAEKYKKKKCVSVFSQMFSNRPVDVNVENRSYRSGEKCTLFMRNFSFFCIANEFFYPLGNFLTYGHSRVWSFCRFLKMKNMRCSSGLPWTSIVHDVSKKTTHQSWEKCMK